MYCVKCGAEIRGDFCSECGAKTGESGKNDQPKILIRSESCTQLVEEKKKASDKAADSLLTTAGVVGILIMFSPYLFAVLDDKKISEAEGPSLPLVLLALIMIIVAFIAFVKQRKVSQELYEKYREYCSKEVLVVDESKIYGSTAKGEMILNYEQIESVGFSPNVWSPSERKPVLGNDIFTVRDVAGNVFVFYSFSNCKDLKTVMDMQMRGR